MTVEQIYSKCKSWIFEKKSSTIYNEQILDITNKVLAETYNENNMKRMFNGKLPFVDGVGAHQVSNMTDEVDYEDEYILDVIPKGIDSYLLMDDDLNKMGILQVEYNNARVANQVCISADKVKELEDKARAI